jgi:hypothetical protein
MGATHDSSPTGHRRALVAVTVAVAFVAAGVLSFISGPSAALFGTTTSAAPPPTRPRPTTTIAGVPTTTSPPPPSTTAAPPATTVPSATTTPPPPPPPRAPPPAEDDEQAPPEQPEPPEPPCADDALDDYYTATKDEVLSVPSQAGLGVNDILCGGTYEIPALSDPPNGTVVKTPNTYGAFDYTPDPGFTGSDSFTYDLVGNQVVVDQATAHILVTETCSMVADSDYHMTPFDTALSVPAPGFLSNDLLECQPYDVVITSAPTDGTLTDNGGGGFDYTPDGGFTGVDQFSYEIHDPNQQVMANSVVTIYVQPPPCAAVDDAYATDIDVGLGEVAPGVLANDTVCPALWSLGVSVPPSHGSVNLGGDGSFVYDPDSGYTGPDSFTYSMYDLGFTTLATATVNIQVGPPPPTTEPETTVPATTEPASTAPATTAPATSVPASTEPGATAPAVATTVPGPGGGPSVPESTIAPAGGVRVASFDASLRRAGAGELTADLSTPDDPQAASVAEIIQRTQPDIVLLNGFDYVADHAAVDLFRANYLEVSQNGADPVEYPYVFTAAVNTGVPSGLDLDNDGVVGGPNDALGAGLFPGQSGMVVLSKFPIVTGEVRTFQDLLWASVPGARLPDDPVTPEPADFYSAEELAVLPLSSASHWDVPIDVDGRIVHVLAAGPTLRDTPRNADEVGFWADYIAGADTSWIVDDAAGSGGLAPGAEFVIVGAMNSDPVDGDSAGAIEQLLGLDRVQDPLPSSEGAVEASATQGLANTSQQGDPANDTADFPDYPGPGNLRADYVLPSDSFDVDDAGVFWPPTSDPLSALSAGDPPTSSNHRLVWVDLA